MILYIWVIGSIVTFMLLIELKDTIKGVNDYLDDQLREEHSNNVLFIAFLLIALGWPLVIILLILDLFNENS